jgi:hypothetical protein
MFATVAIFFPASGDSQFLQHTLCIYLLIVFQNPYTGARPMDIETVKEKVILLYVTESLLLR